MGATTSTKICCRRSFSTFEQGDPTAKPTKIYRTKADQEAEDQKAKKAAEADMEVQEESLMEELERIPVASASDHPHRSAEELIKDRDGR